MQGRVHRGKRLAAAALRSRSPADDRRLRDDRSTTARDGEVAEDAGRPGGLHAWIRTTRSATWTPRAMLRNEGDVQVGGFPPYPISYRSSCPKAGSATICWCQSACRPRTSPMARSAWSRSSWSSASRRQRLRVRPSTMGCPSNPLTIRNVSPRPLLDDKQVLQSSTLSGYPERRETKGRVWSSSTRPTNFGRFMVGLRQPCCAIVPVDHDYGFPDSL